MRKGKTSGELRPQAHSKRSRPAGKTPDRAADVVHAHGPEFPTESASDEVRPTRIESENSRQRYADLYDFAPVGYFTLDIRGRILEANLTGADLLATPRDRLLNKLFDRYIHPNERMLSASHRHAVCEYGGKHKCELRLKSDPPKYVQLDSVAAGEGELRCCRCTLIDITARKQAEIESRRSQEQLRTLIDGVRDHALIMLDADGNIVTWNAGAERMFGYTDTEIVGRSVGVFFSAEDLRSGALQREFSIARSAGHAVGECWHTRKDGAQFWASSVLNPLWDDAGRLRGFVKVIHDATERLEALQERERLLHTIEIERARFEAVLQQMPAGVIIVDAPGGELRLHNAQVDEILKLPAGALADVYWYKNCAVFYPDGRQYGADELPIMRSIKFGEVVTGEELEYLRGDGVRCTLEVAAAPIRNRDNDIVAAVATFQDVTHRKHAQRETLKANKLESIGLLAGGIAHDFNNVLTGIVGNLYLARLSLQPSDAAFTSLNEAEKACLRAKTLTHQLLTFSKGGAPIKKTTSLVAFLQEIAAQFAHGSDLRCELSAPRDLLYVEADLDQLRQAIDNILTNARQAMPQGGTVQIVAENVLIGKGSGLPLAAGHYVKIIVVDRGIGIEPHIVPNIFDPFFTTKPSGSGLGLAAAYSIVRKHDGHIQVETAPGEGTAFSVYIPASMQQTVLLAQRGSSQRVLFMDDEETIRSFASRVLEHFGYETECVADGAAAIAAYRAARAAGKPFNLVVLDLTVPGGMGGRQTMEKLREIDPGVRAIVSSGYSNDPAMADHRRLGFIDVVVKPYSIEELRQKVAGAIDVPYERRHMPRGGELPSLQ